MSAAFFFFLPFSFFLLAARLVGRSQGFDFIHSRVEVLDVLRRVQTGRVVVLAGHHFGTKTAEWQSAPVVGRADVFHLLPQSMGKKKKKKKARLKI